MYIFNTLDEIHILLISIVYFYSRLQGKSQIVQDELVRLGEQMVNGVEGTRALALELCREFEDKFLQHIGSGEVGLLFYLFIYFFHSSTSA